MKPYTRKERNRDNELAYKKYCEEKNQIVETNCCYLGEFDGYTPYPYECRLDSKHRDCEGRCEYYKPKSFWNYFLS